MILGQGDFRYELVEGWLQMPENFTFGDGSSGIPAGAAGVAVDSKDRVFIFCRGPIRSSYLTNQAGLFPAGVKDSFLVLMGFILGRMMPYISLTTKRIR